jgi:hypothetical protein
MTTSSELIRQPILELEHPEVQITELGRITLLETCPEDYSTRELRRWRVAQLGPEDDDFEQWEGELGGGKGSGKGGGSTGN